MHIGIIGASGNIGQRVMKEALDRHHQITAFTRGPVKTKPDHDGSCEWQTIDVFDVASLVAALTVTPGIDVLVSGYQPGNAAIDLADTLDRSIADPSVYATVARNLLKALEVCPRTRLLVVGGAGSLEVAPGVRAVDSPDSLRAALKAIGLPEDYARAVLGHSAALDVYRLSNRLWTYFSPAADIHAGERTGRFRLGGDQALTDAEGRSRISYEDFAVALIDECELPRHLQRRFTIGY